MRGEKNLPDVMRAYGRRSQLRRKEQRKDQKMNDWTLIETAYVTIAICAIPALIGVVIGIWEALKWIWRTIRNEVEFRYIFRAVRNPKKYRKMRRNAKEPIWDFLLWIFKIKT